MAKMTPGTFKVLEIQGAKFVAAEPYEGHPYFGRTRTIEVFSDEDYPTKDADIQAASALPELLAGVRRAIPMVDYVACTSKIAKVRKEATALVTELQLALAKSGQ